METLSGQFERAASVRKLWELMFPGVPIAEDRILTWVLAFPDNFIALGIKRAKSKHRRGLLSGSDIERYASSVMSHEGNGEHKFEEASGASSHL